MKQFLNSRFYDLAATVRLRLGPHSEPFHLFLLQQIKQIVMITAQIRPISVVLLHPLHFSLNYSAGRHFGHAVM